MATTTMTWYVPYWRTRVLVGLCLFVRLAGLAGVYQGAETTYAIQSVADWVVRGGSLGGR